MRLFVAALVLPLFLATLVCANGGPPRQFVQPANTGKVEIRVDEKADQARLVIPRKFLEQRRADAGIGEPDKAVADAGRSPLHLAIAGVALSLAVTFGGLWLVRSRGKLGVARTLLLAACTLFIVGGVVLANVAVNPNGGSGNNGNNTGNFGGNFGGFGGGQGVANRAPAVPLPAGIIASEKVVVEVVDKGDAVVLVINPAMKGKLAEKPAKDEPKTRK
jgi:hypothetical protein